MQDKKKALEQYFKQLKEGIPFAEDFIDADNDLKNNALLARNLSEETLADQIMKNTGIPVPDKTASGLKKEDFLNRIISENYPEFKDPSISLGDSSFYQDGKISVDKKGDIITNVADSFHEAGHKFDDEFLDESSIKLKNDKFLKDLQRKGKNLKEVDPAELYEMISEGHHAKIPDIRENSYGLSNLKNVLKGKPIRSLVGPAAGIGLAALSDNASASDFIPGLDQAENVGNEDDDLTMIGELEGLKNYDNSPAGKNKINRTPEDRLKLLEKISKGE